MTVQKPCPMHSVYSLTHYFNEYQRKIIVLTQQTGFLKFSLPIQYKKSKTHEIYLT